MTLFNVGEFILHSGERSNFKIDCDFLRDQDLEALASHIAPQLPPFVGVYGVPSGGTAFATKLLKYTSTEATQWLIVDDVYTTGRSMEEAKQMLEQDARIGSAIGLVIFARRIPPKWIRPIFVML